ncbi:hypothetical protein DM01DRAFT_1409116, partial [Hesseltinella vesiculosa]
MTIHSRLTIQPQLLNAKFEGYKLETFPEDKQLIRSTLPFGRLQVTRQGQLHSSRLGFRELQARVRFNHLTMAAPYSDAKATCYFVDSDYNVIAVTFNADTRSTAFDKVIELSKPMEAIPNYTQPSDTTPLQTEYPSIVSLDHELILAANGYGHIDLVQLARTQGACSGTVVASYAYPGLGNEGVSPVPCVLLAARRIASNKIVLVAYSQTPTKKSGFNIATVELVFTLAGKNVDQHDALTIRHIQQGSEVPVYCDLTPDGQTTVLTREEPLTCVLPEVTDKDTDPIGTFPSSADPLPATPAPAPPPPYQWTQEGADFTLQFQLPAGTPKSAVRCQLTKDHLTLFAHALDQELVYPFRKWWSSIKSDESTWFLEPSGMLSLCLVKQDEHTRWPHVFDIDDNVLETLDKEQLERISKQLDRLAEASDMAMHPAATDMDEDIDEDGTPMQVDLIDANGHCTHAIQSGQQWLGRAFDLQRFPCLTSDNSNGELLASITTKVDVDGPVYGWHGDHLNHIATFHALGYIQASKRDQRFTFHDPGLQFAVIVESSRNAYVYYHHPDLRLHEQQTLIDVTAGHDSDILGVQLILDRVLMFLTESHVVVAFL